MTATPVPPPVAQDDLTLAELARAVLARELRPRVASVRRLAQAVLDREEKRARKKAAKGERKGKLARIPGGKGKKG